MLNVSFRPSQVRPFFPSSAFNNSEKEIMAAQIVSFLSMNDSWETVIVVSALFEHSKTATFPSEVYNNPFENPFLLRGCINALWWFVDNKFITWVEERRSFSVTEKMTGFYTPYVRPAN